MATAGPDFDALPAQLHETAAGAWAALVEADDGVARRLAADPGIAATVPAVFAASEFVTRSCTRYPDMLAALVDEGALTTPWQPGSLDAGLGALLGAEADEAAAMLALRRFRRREMVRIAWRDLAGFATLEETLGHLSELADVCIAAAVEHAARSLADRFGRPVGRDGDVQPLVVMGMGKLGGGELNFSSDVDLVFLFPGAGETDGRRPIANDQYFVRLGQRVIRLLDEPTADGRVFRVDMRLRPFGDSGPLAVSFTAFEAYLQEHGRTWERYAWVKARPITGYAPGQGLYRDILRPFVYRRYLDFGVFESLRNMKALVVAEVERRELDDNVKLGAGGIREIEFITQTFQILRGGHDAELRDARLLAVLPRLADGRPLDDECVGTLESAYRFLRRLENRLQAWQDAQTHALPADEPGRARLAFAMGYDDWASLSADIHRHRVRVHALFLEHMTPSGEAQHDTAERDVAAVWQPGVSDDARIPLLAEAGFEDPDRAAAMLRQFEGAGYLKRMDEAGRRRLDAMLPVLLAAAGRLTHPEQVLERLLRVVEAVGLRTAYFALLNEHPGVLQRLASICGQSSYLAEEVARHPVLLDELIDPRVIEELPTRADLEATLDHRLASVAEDDLEARMDVIRRFQRASVFLVAVADLTGKLPLMKVSDHLTAIAEVVLEVCVAAARAAMEERFGAPMCGDGDTMRETGFAVIGYGKLGGLELGYGSDLDLVFVHDSEGPVQRTAGPSVKDNGVFFARLTSRIVHMLSTQTASGALYEVDTRLRPSGSSGLLVTSLSAFESYQREEAWTWEHQALLRARGVAGDARVLERFEDLRRRLLCEAVDRGRLKQRVADMRERMRRELVSTQGDAVDIKQDRGGIADIEFLVQYLALMHAPDAPALVGWSDNVRQLDALVEAGVLDSEPADVLREAYLDFRARLHRLRLEGLPGRVPAEAVRERREAVTALWQATMG